MPVLRTTVIRRALEGIGGKEFGHHWLNRMSGASGVFRSFPEAHRVAARLGLGGHNEPKEIEFYSHVFRQSDYPVLYWLSRIAPHRLFDFGGAVGGLHFLYRDYLDDVLSVDWVVYDLADVVERGRQRAAGNRTSGLRFTSDLSEGGASDVFLASGSLHYWEDSLPALFALLGERPKHVLINRTPMTGVEPYVVIQKRPNVALPSMIRNRAALISEFEELGYLCVDQWVEPTRGFTVPLFPRYDVNAYSGLYFRLK